MSKGEQFTPSVRTEMQISYAATINEAIRTIRHACLVDQAPGSGVCAECTPTIDALAALAALVEEIESGTSVTHNTVDLCNRIAAGYRPEAE
jgi:hypothetical protein